MAAKQVDAWTAQHEPLCAKRSSAAHRNVGSPHTRTWITARRAGRDAKSLTQHARFAEGSTAVQRYMRQADEFSEQNATADIGL